MPLSYRVEDKMRLSKDKTQLKVNPSLTLSGIPPEAFDYRLGNRSALEWVIDQYQVGFNDMKYCNPELDEINAQAKRTFDEETRRELLIQASNIVNDEQPVGVMHFRRDIIAYSDRLQNFIPSAWGVDLTYVWIQQ